MDPRLQALVIEWFTGRDANGNESVRFAVRWRDYGGIVGRQYRPHLRDLRSPLLAYATEGRMSIAPIVGLAVGVDGETDLRIETRDGGRLIFRWRPAAAARTLDDVDDRGSTLRERTNQTAEADALAKALRDPALLRLPAAMDAVMTLRLRLRRLRERLEARTIAGLGTAAVQSAIDDIEARLAQLRLRIGELKTIERAKALAEEGA